MSQARGGLGRGLGALIPTGPADVSRETSDGLTAWERGDEPSATPGRAAAWDAAPSADDSRDPSELTPVGGIRLVDVPLDLIRPNPRQPRQVFEPEALDELVISLREVGVLQPIVVRTDPTDPARYELIMGERRWRAAQRAGLGQIPAIVRETPDDALLRDALLENLHRSQLNPLEEGAAYQQLLDEFGVTHDELATRIGRSRSQVSNTIRLLGLPPTVQRRVAAGVLSAGHARALLSLPNAADVEAMAARIVAEGLSVRSVEELVALVRTPGTPRKPRATRVPTSDPRTIELATRVADHLDTAVHVETSRAKSRLVVEVADVEDLARVVALILEARPADAPDSPPDYP